MNRQSNIIHEPCTLVYTLLDCSIIPFNDFELLVRSLHNYMVEAIIPNPDLQNVHVKLNYQASVANAQAKLADLQSIVAVTKLSSFVKENEFPRLEQLRRRFGIGSGDQTSGGVQPVPYRTPSKPRQSRGRGRPKCFAPRAAPYTISHQNSEQSVDTAPEYQDNQGFEASHTADIYTDSP